MKKRTYAELTNDELLKKMKLAKQFLLSFIIIYFIVIGIVLFLFFYKDFKASVGLMIPIFVIPVTLTPLYASYNMLKQEYKSRKL